MEHNQVWTREFTSMAIINSFFAIIFFLFMVTMVPYTIETYGASISIAGLVASVFVIGSLIGRIVVGNWIKRYGVLKVLEISLLFFIVSSIGYFMMWNLEALFVVRILHGIAAGIIGTATGTISMQVVPVSRRAEGIAYYSSSAVIGAALGPFLGIWLLNIHNGFVWIFALNLMFGIISFLVLKGMKLKVEDVKSPLQEATSIFNISNIIEVKALPIALIALTIGFCFSSVTSFLVTYSKEIDLAKAASYYFFVHASCIVCTRFFTGKLIDVKGANIVMYPSLLLFSIGLFCYSQATVVWMLLGAAAMISTGFGNFNSGAQTLAVKDVAPHRLGIATATYFIFMDIGSGIGPYLLGFIIEHIGYRTLYLVASCIGVLCIPIYYYFYGRREKNLKEQEQFHVSTEI